LENVILVIAQMSGKKSAVHVTCFVYRRLPWSRSTCCRLPSSDWHISVKAWPTYYRRRWRHEL